MSAGGRTTDYCLKLSLSNEGGNMRRKVLAARSRAWITNEQSFVGARCPNERARCTAERLCIRIYNTYTTAHANASWARAAAESLSGRGSEDDNLTSASTDRSPRGQNSLSFSECEPFASTLLDDSFAFGGAAYYTGCFIASGNFDTPLNSG